MAVQAISSVPATRRSGCATAVGIVTLVASVLFGAAVGYFLSLRPLYELYTAQSWTPASCVVVSSRLEEGEEGPARAEIVYRYTVGDRQYTADRYDFIPGKTSDASLPAAVASHPAGRRFECYVDPEDPTRAVVNRTHRLWYHLGTLFLVLFSGLPLAIGLLVLRAGRTERRAQRALAGTMPAGDDRHHQAAGAAAGPIVLKPSATPVGKLIGLAAVCLFWNGIVGVFTAVEYHLYQKGDSNWWLLGAFLLLFQIIGAVFLWAVIKQALSLANPRPVLTLSRATVPLGGTVSFAWQLTGAAHRVTRLRMTLKGREEARYRRGTDTHTDTHEFFSTPIVDVSHGSGIARGSGTIHVPRDTMHSFAATNNKILWTLEVAGTIERWPDLDETFEIAVTPA